MNPPQQQALPRLALRLWASPPGPPRPPQRREQSLPQQAVLLQALARAQALPPERAQEPVLARALERPPQQARGPAQAQELAWVQRVPPLGASRFFGKPKDQSQSLPPQQVHRPSWSMPTSHSSAQRLCGMCSGPFPWPLFHPENLPVPRQLLQHPLSRSAWLRLRCPCFPKSPRWFEAPD